MELFHKNFNSNYIFEKNCNSTDKISWYLEKNMLLPFGLTADNVRLSAANAGIDKEKHRFSLLDEAVKDSLYSNALWNVWKWNK